MGTISRAKVSVSATGVGVPIGTNLSGQVSIGETIAKSYDDADIVACINITANAAGDLATITYSDLTVAQTTGSPVILDGDGKDFEGSTFPTMARVYAILNSCPSTNSFPVSVGGVATVVGGIAFSDFGAGTVIGAATAAVQFSAISGAAGDTITITIIGKSS